MRVFDCDYHAGAHPRVLAALSAANAKDHATYGYDAHSQRAEALLRGLTKADVEVHFIAGGTLCNLTLIRAALKVYEGVFAAVEGHIATHETGAIEATGHKVIALPSGRGAMAGKLCAADIRAAMEDDLNDPHNEHVVKPGMVYISQPTELGTLYQEEELRALADVCRKYGLLLYCDGARLASAIGHFGAGHYALLAECCDAFSIGGTKCGALFGEALVVRGERLRRGLRHVIKQSGARMAKGYLIACQFEALLEDGLYEEIGRHCNALAMQIRKAFEAKGHPFLSDSVSNQQFVLLPEEAAKKISQCSSALLWKQYPDGRRCLRLITDFQHSQADLDALTSVIAAL